MTTLYDFDYDYKQQIDFQTLKVYVTNSQGSRKWVHLDLFNGESLVAYLVSA